MQKQRLLAVAGGLMIFYSFVRFNTGTLACRTIQSLNIILKVMQLLSRHLRSDFLKRTSSKYTGYFGLTAV